MTEQEYRKLRAQDAIGRTIKTLEAISNGGYTIPAGTLATITGKREGYALTTFPCGECGVQVHITRVLPRYVDLVNEQSEPTTGTCEG